MIGDKLRTKMHIYGNANCINTAKCLQTAAEKGVNIETEVIDSNNLDAEAMRVSPLKLFPALKDIDFTVAGTLGVMSYLDDKGFGMSLVPRNGVLRAHMYGWIMLALEHQDKIMQGDVAGLAPVLDVLDQWIANAPKKGHFICGEFCLADIHWSSCMNMLEIKGHSEEISSRSNLKVWYERVKEHPSTSKEKIIPFMAIPTADDIQNNQLRDISITV